MTASTLLQMPPPGGVAPVAQAAPVVAAAQLGVALTWTPAVFSGYPPPAVTYDVIVNGALVAGGSLSGVYLPVTLGGSLTVVATATNKAGSTQATSIPITVGL